MVLKRMEKKNPKLIGICPYCNERFEYPYEDRVDVVLFGNWRKYHTCSKIDQTSINPSRRERNV